MDAGQPRPEARAAGKPLGVPSSVLAKGAHSRALAEPAGEPLRVLEHDVRDLAEIRRIFRLASCEDVGQVAEQPRTPQATAAHHDPVAAGDPHHAQRILCLPDVAVSQDRDRSDRRLQLRDGLPPRLAGVELSGGPCVQRDGDTALVLGDPAGVEVRLVLVAHSHAELDGHGHPSGMRHRCANDPAQEPGPERDRSPTALSRDLRYRASEVEVDVIHVALADEPGHGLTHVVGIDAVELEATRPLVGGEVGELARAWTALEEGPGGDHLAHAHPRSEAPAQRSEGGVGDPRHGSQDDWRRHGDRTEGERGKLPLCGRGDVAVDLAAVARIHLQGPCDGDDAQVYRGG